MVMVMVMVMERRPRGSRVGDLVNQINCRLEGPDLSNLDLCCRCKCLGAERTTKTSDFSDKLCMSLKSLKWDSMK